jgi:hypothetical protein
LLDTLAFMKAGASEVEEEQTEELAAISSERAQRLTHTLTAYYTAHGPENLGNIPALVARVVGGPPSVVGGIVVGGMLWTEEDLFAKMEAKYGAKVELSA